MFWFVYHAAMASMRRSAILLVFLLLACGDNASVPDEPPDAGVPGKITLIGRSPTSGLPVHDVWRYTSPAGGDFALLCAGEAGLRVIDLADKANPVEVGRIGGGAGLQATDVKTWKNFAYVVGEGPSPTGSILDLSDPSRPVEAGSFPSAHTLFISDSGHLLAADPGLRIYDLNANPLAPTEVFRKGGCQGHAVAVIGNRLYEFGYDCGTRIYDFTLPASPVLLGTVVDASFSHHSGWPSSNGSHLFVTDELAGVGDPDIRVFDIRNLAAPAYVGQLADPRSFVHNMYVAGDQAYVSHYRAGFRVLDVSNPTAITILDEYDTDPQMAGPGYGGSYGVHASGADGVILVSDESNGLFLFTVNR